MAPQIGWGGLQEEKKARTNRISMELFFCSIRIPTAEARIVQRGPARTIQIGRGMLYGHTGHVFLHVSAHTFGGHRFVLRLESVAYNGKRRLSIGTGKARF